MQEEAKLVDELAPAEPVQQSPMVLVYTRGTKGVPIVRKVASDMMQKFLNPMDAAPPSVIYQTELKPSEYALPLHELAMLYPYPRDK